MFFFVGGVFVLISTAIQVYQLPLQLLSATYPTMTGQIANFTHNIIMVAHGLDNLLPF